MNDDHDREELLAQLGHLRSLAEKAYSDMYTVGSPSAASSCFCQARRCYSEAIVLAGRLGLAAEAATMRRRLEQIEALYREQFS